jgi:tetratricopeptide (TPR) repeat protein
LLSQARIIFPLLFADRLLCHRSHIDALSKVLASSNHVLLSAGQYDEAASQCEKLLAGFNLGRAWLGQGKTHEAIRILEAFLHEGVNAGSEVWGELGYAYARAGRRDDAERLAASTPLQNPFNRAVTFAGLGDTDRTLEALHLAAAGGPFRIGRAFTSPEFALLRGDPRVKALCKKVGLPEYLRRLPATIFETANALAFGGGGP